MGRESFSLVESDTDLANMKDFTQDKKLNNHVKNLGRLLQNLLSLEFALRACIFNNYGVISHQIDRQKILRIRGGIAHGRICSDDPQGPFKVFKFSRPENGQVSVEIAIDMTKEWFKRSINLFHSEVQNIKKIHDTI